MGSGGLAQLGEHLLCKQGVVGSIPSSSTSNSRGSAEYGRCAAGADTSGGRISQERLGADGARGLLTEAGTHIVPVWCSTMFFNNQEEAQQM